jgi:hypothetical protein
LGVSVPAALLWLCTICFIFTRARLWPSQWWPTDTSQTYL